MSEIDSELKRIKNLVQNKGKSEEELLKQANINCIVRNFKNNPLFVYDGADTKIKEVIEKENNISLEKFKNYLENYNIESDSDLSTLKSLIFTEVIEVRLQRNINDLTIEGKSIPRQSTEQLIQVQDQITTLKIKLGIDKTEVQDSELTKLEKLEKRFQRYIEENRNEFTLDVPLICQKCNHEAKYNFLLRRRLKDFDAVKNPWFVGRFFFNYEILKDVKKGKLSKEDAWRYMSSCATGEEFKNTAFGEKYCADYIDWCLANWGEITSMLDEK